MRQIVDCFAEYERAIIRARTRAALAVKKARGERVGGLPFGYQLAACGLTMTLPLLAPRGAARRLNLSTSRLMQLDREGKLPALRDSAGRRLYQPEAVERFAQERGQATAEAGAATRHS